MYYSLFIYYYSFDILTANLLKPHWGLTTTAFRAPLLSMNGPGPAKCLACVAGAWK